MCKYKYINVKIPSHIYIYDSEITSIISVVKLEHSIFGKPIFANPHQCVQAMFQSGALPVRNEVITPISRVKMVK